MKRALSLACGLACLLCGRSNAATFQIGNGDVSALIGAMTTANGNLQDDVINLAPNGLYQINGRNNGLNAMPEVVSDNGHTVTINGNGATIQRNGSATNLRFFYVASGGNLTITNLDLFNGNAGPQFGGAIENDGDTGTATLTVSGCLFDTNTAGYGGAIFNNGFSEATTGNSSAILTVSDCTFINNSAGQYGGAIWTTSGAANTGVTGTSVLNITNSTFNQNTAALDAGAIQHDGSSGNATGTISNSVFTHNSAGTAHDGGAINVDGASGNAALTISNCTFDQNSAGHGGAIAMDGTNGAANVNVVSCTLSGNSASTLAGGIYVFSIGAGTTALQIGNTILKTGVAGANLATDGGGFITITSQGYNLSNDAAGGGAGAAPGGLLNHSGDKRNLEPQLDPAGLKNNGGLTQTIALQSGSQALDQGKSNTIGSLTFDQRGEPRPFDDPNLANAAGGDGSDIGAYEATVRAVNFARSGNNFVISFTTILGHTYEVQSRTSLTSGTWANVTNTSPAPPIAGTGGIIQVTVPNAFSLSPDFYHLLQLP